MAIRLRKFNYEDEYPQNIIDNWSSFDGILQEWQEATNKISKNDLLKCSKLDHETKMSIKSMIHDYFKAVYHDKDVSSAKEISNDIFAKIRSKVIK